MSPIPAILNLDARLKLLATLCIGVLVWRTGFAGLGIACASLCLIIIPLAKQDRRARELLRGYGKFVMFWMIVMVGVRLWDGLSIHDAVFHSLTLAWRLATLLMLGVALALTTSPRSLGLALSSLLAPVMGRKRSWRVALAMSLMVHFIPMSRQALQDVRTSASLRPSVPLSRRLTLMPVAMLRAMGRLTWDQTLAVASRGLDRASAWQNHGSWGRNEWLGSFLLIIFAILLYIS